MRARPPAAVAAVAALAFVTLATSLLAVACGERRAANVPPAATTGATATTTGATATTTGATAPAPVTPTDATARRPTTVDATGAKDAVFTPWALPTGFQPIAIPPAFLPPWLAGTPGMPTLPGVPTMPGVPAVPTVAPTPPVASPVPTVTAARAVAVFLYGHPTCGACKAADEHMKAKAIAYVYRNVDDDAANREMWTKLRAAGKDGSSVGIPVIDVDGDLLVGWSESSFDKMYATAQSRR